MHAKCTGCGRARGRKKMQEYFRLYAEKKHFFAAPEGPQKNAKNNSAEPADSAEPVDSAESADSAESTDSAESAESEKI